MTLEQTKRMTRAWFLALAAVIAMLGATCICLSLVGACVEGAVKFVVEAPTTQPYIAIPVEAPITGAELPPLPEGPLNKLAIGLAIALGIAALAAVVLWFSPSPAARLKRLVKRG